MQTQNQILTVLNKIQKDLADVKKKIEDLEPVYGSDAWWKWSDERALKDIKEGRYTTVHSKEELIKHLDSLK